MNDAESKYPSPVDATISKRAGFGSNALVRGWQAMLAQLLSQLKPYLKPARIITFAQLTPIETALFERIESTTQLPASACGVFISPSVRNQIFYTNRGRTIPDEGSTPPDDGVVLFCNPDCGDPIINVLLAHPPYAAAVDVYHQGGLLAGYVYDTIDDCLSSLSDVVHTYLENH